MNYEIMYFQTFLFVLNQLEIEPRCHVDDDQHG